MKTSLRLLRPEGVVSFKTSARRWRISALTVSPKSDALRLSTAFSSGETRTSMASVFFGDGGEARLRIGPT